MKILSLQFFTITLLESLQKISTKPFCNGHQMECPFEPAEGTPDKTIITHKLQFPELTARTHHH